METYVKELPVNETSLDIYDIKEIMAMFTFFYWLLALAICISNSIAIVVVWRTPTLRTISKMYKVALAVADFLTGLSVPFYTLTNFPSMVVYMETRPYVCLARYVLLYTFLSNSFLCIALGRFVFVVYPLRYHKIFSIRKTRFTILMTWVVSLTGGLSTLLDINWTGKCEVFGVLKRRYQLYGMIPYMRTILLLTAVLYIDITGVAMKQRRIVSSLIIIAQAKEHYLRRSTIKSMRLFLVVYGMFVLFWAPSYVLTILGLTIGATPLAFQISLTLGIANSAINFVIYSLMSKEFRKAFKELVRGKCSNCE